MHVNQLTGPSATLAERRQARSEQLEIHRNELAALREQQKQIMEAWRVSAARELSEASRDMDAARDHIIAEIRALGSSER